MLIVSPLKSEDPRVLSGLMPRGALARGIVTLKFADRVGEILTASPRGMKAPPLPFRFYIERGQVGTDSYFR